jgi:hypothetical protein
MTNGQPQQPMFYPDNQYLSPNEYGANEIIRSISSSIRVSKEDFEHVLAGEKKMTSINKDGIPQAIWVKVNNAPIVNDVGREEIITFLDPLMSESNAWSDLSSASALEKYKEIAETIARMITFNMEAWGLHLSDLHTLQIMIENFVDISVLRKIEGKKMFDMLQKTVKESRHIVEQTDSKQGRGLFR